VLDSLRGTQSHEDSSKIQRVSNNNYVIMETSKNYSFKLTKHVHKYN